MSKQKMKGIIQPTEMVKAIAEDRKTMMRVKPSESVLAKYYDYEEWCDMVTPRDVPCTREFSSVKQWLVAKSPYRVGQVLYVKEGWLYVMQDHAHELLEGRRENSLYVVKSGVHSDWIGYAKERHFYYKFNSPVTMPSKAARIFLRVMSVRVERLNEISEEDAMREGVEKLTPYITFSPKGERLEKFYWKNYKDGAITQDFVNLSGNVGSAKISYATLWQSTHKQHTWESNPFVWVIEFERISKEDAYRWEAGYGHD